MPTLQIDRSNVTNTPPAALSLRPGELYIEMANPARLWVGVPTSIAISGRISLFKADYGVQAGAGLVASGNFLEEPVTISHANTSEAVGGAFTGALVLEHLSLDIYGHVTVLTKKNLTPAAIGAANLAHTHVAADILATPAQLGAAALVHTHAQADVTGLVDALAGKAPLAGAAFTGGISAAGIQINAKVTETGVNGGELILASAASDVVTAGNFAIRATDHAIKIMETLSPFRGFVLDFAAGAAANAATELLHKGNSPIPAGTNMLFYQSAAPTGWFKATAADFNDRALRITTGSIVNGGTAGFSAVFGQSATGGTAISTAQMPVHTVPLPTTSADSNDIDGTGFIPLKVAGPASTTQSDPVGSGATHTHPIELRVKYLDIIIATKAS